MADGILLVDKEAGCTSHDVVQLARRALGQKKVGHCGTLDPDATGLLLLTVGNATRLTRFFIKAPKIYEGRVRFGVATDTYDASGKEISKDDPSSLTVEAVEQAMANLVGTYLQAAPPFSAKKVGGVKHYQLARKGVEVPEAKKEISVFEFSAMGQLEDDSLAFRLSCSSGTYARSLAHDLGQVLGCGAHLSSLRRVRIGEFEVSSAVAMAQLQRASADKTPGGGWIPFDEITLPFTEMRVDKLQEQRIGHGQTVLLREAQPEEGDWMKLVNQRGQFVAVGLVKERIGSGKVSVIQPKIVFL